MYKVKQIDSNDYPKLDQIWEKDKNSSIFSSFHWNEIYSSCFGMPKKILGVYKDEQLVSYGIFHEVGGKVTFLASNPVLDGELLSDYADIVSNQFEIQPVWEQLIKHFEGKEMELFFVRQDSNLPEVLCSLGFEKQEIDLSLSLNLPVSFDDYLLTLSGHNRHELRRKMRRIEDGNKVELICGQSDDFEIFFTQLKMSKKDKEEFAKPQIEVFFKNIYDLFSKKGIAKIYQLKINNESVASVLVFIYKNQILLYNSGYDLKYSHYSPGLMIKSYLIKEAIRLKFEKFDFLRGGEEYKYRLGAKKIILYKLTKKT